MADDLDRYEAWYTEKLWNALPAIYRVDDRRDSDPDPDFDAKGSLREVVERIGAQVAVVRRSIDRLWEDQSIESCEDWVIDYIGELLATNLVASLDARGRRVDVGKTIYYRRRKGTLPLLEELAGDITGWNVRVVEFFRRMERTRHNLDPAIGIAAPATTPRGRLQREQGFIGLRTRTAVGGTADLRNVHGASLAGTAFDEYFHTADVRRGRGATGRYNIPHLGVFVWRLKTFEVVGAEAVHDVSCTNQHTFDPTGRDIRLFAAGERRIGDEWVSPREHEVPGPISRPLLQAAFDELYREGKKAHSLAIHRETGGPPGHDHTFLTSREVEQDPRAPTTKPTIDPTRGRIIGPVGAAAGAYHVDYHYGFASEIGAGPYDRRIGSVERTPAPIDLRVRFGTGLDTALAAGSGTISIDDSLTYSAIDEDVDAITSLTLRARNLCRPLIRSKATQWVFTGAGKSSTLELDGLFISGGTEIVLRGEFARVRLSCCTFDPGSWGKGTWMIAADGVPLSPTRLVIAADIRVLEIDRCILGPISDSGSGRAETLMITDSIVQAADTGDLAMSLVNGTTALSRCTILGRAQAHRLDVSESILHDITTVDDTSHGCVRFTAWADGSVLPRRYESVKISAEADLFASRSFGDPAYGQLVASGDTRIVEGAEDGSEMGAFAREKTAIKERSLLIKYQEYLPLGIEPVIVHVT
jgi:hypothetical protein